MNEDDKTDDDKVKGGLKDFDDMLKLVGGWGPFQYLLVIIFFPFNIFLGYVYLSPILTVFTPPHWCLIPDLMNLTMVERKKMGIPLDTDTGGGYSQCSQYITDWSKVGRPSLIYKEEVTSLKAHDEITEFKLTH